MNLDAIRTNWQTLHGLTGLGPIHDEEDYDRMVALADALIASGLAAEGGDLPEIGSQGVVSEILAGRRMLNTRQIAALVARFNTSADMFIKPAFGHAH